jgi:hypothetical protein
MTKGGSNRLLSSLRCLNLLAASTRCCSFNLQSHGSRAKSTSASKRLTFHDSVSYCRDIVYRYDRENYIASLFYPASTRPFVWALRAFNYELATIRDNVKESTLGRMRFQFWRDLIDQVKDVCHIVICIIRF